MARAKEAVTFNFKGALLERGGTVRIKERGETARAESRAGGGAPPCYVAVATLGTRECEAEAGSIRDSEREAARLVLTQSGVELVGLPKKERTMLPSTPPAVRRPNQRSGPPRGPPRGAAQGWARLHERALVRVVRAVARVGRLARVRQGGLRAAVECLQRVKVDATRERVAINGNPWRLRSGVGPPQVIDTALHARRRPVSARKLQLLSQG